MSAVILQFRPRRVLPFPEQQRVDVYRDREPRPFATDVPLDEALRLYGGGIDRLPGVLHGLAVYGEALIGGGYRPLATVRPSSTGGRAS